MNQLALKELLSLVKHGECSVKDAAQQLQCLSSETMQDACIDHHRTLRTGIPEVIYGASKTADQIISIASALLRKKATILATRVDSVKAQRILEKLPELDYHPKAHIISGNPRKPEDTEHRGTIVIICAGTSDIPIAEEAKITAECLGNPVEALYDVGVAGLHRLLDKQHMFQKASVIIVVAGMEGALPSVVGGLVSCPVIGVPTSIGYGANFGGIAALLGMLNSCVPSLSVVNIDNGFGAACMATSINRKLEADNR